MIQNYGLFWREEDVYWGERGYGNRGAIAGYIPAHVPRIVDFSDQVGIYVLYADYQLVYIGQTGRTGGNAGLKARINAHRSNHLARRWNQFSWFGFRRVREPNGDHDLWQLTKKPPDSNTSTIIDHLESVLIYMAEPPLNRHSGRFASATQYLQHRDEESLGPPERDMVKAIWDRNGE